MFHRAPPAAEDAPGRAVPSGTRTQRREDVKQKRLKRLQKSRITLGLAYPRWKSLLRDKCFKSHADVAFYLLDSFEDLSSSLTSINVCPVPAPAAFSFSASTGADSLEDLSVPASAAFSLGVSSGPDSGDFLKIFRGATGHQDPEQREADCWDPSTMASPQTLDQEMDSAPENGQEAGEMDGGCERSENGDEASSAQQQDKGDVEEEEEEEEEISRTRHIGDGQCTVDLGSPLQLVVEEACLLQLFRSCHKCRRKCRYTKRVEGLKLQVSLSCTSCESRREWTNLLQEHGDVTRRGASDRRAHGERQMNGNDGDAVPPPGHDVS